MTIRATIAEPVEPTVASVFGSSVRTLRKFHVKARQEWRLIPIGLRGKVRRVLVVYLNRKAAA